MFDVLEHIEDPIGFLGHCKTILKSNGILTITTPSLEAVPFGDDTTLRKWKHWKPKEHLYLYTEMGIMALLSKIGMEPIHWGHEESDIRPQNPNGDIMTCVARKKS
jgi:predicted SAM-dependent methyltransferase